MSKSDSSNPTELLGLALRFAQSAARSGYVLLATTTLCLTLTMVLARAWWTWEEQQENRFRTHVTTLLAQQTDRFKSSNHQLLLAALLESSIVQKFGCPNDALEHIDEEVRIGPLCEEIEGIFKDFDQVEKDFKAASLENPSQQTNKIAVKVEECRQTSKKCSDSSMVDADHPVYGNAGCVTNAALFIHTLMTRIHR
jgi:hypothetical protein